MVSLQDWRQNGRSSIHSGGFRVLMGQEMHRWCDGEIPDASETRASTDAAGKKKPNR